MRLALYLKINTDTPEGIKQRRGHLMFSCLTDGTWYIEQQPQRNVSCFHTGLEVCGKYALGYNAVQHVSTHLTE